MSEVVQAWLWGLPWVLGALTAVWGVSVLRRDVSVIDVFWGPGFALAAFVGLPDDGLPGQRAALLLIAVVLWAARLGGHLGLRWLRKGEEDPRYAAMRAEHPETFPLRSLVTVFWLQGLLIWLFSGPVVATLHRSGAPGVMGWVGLALFALGLLLEAVADAQLAAFRARPDSSGQVLDRGLWRYSRHPNYFGEAVLWWGIAGVTVDAGVWTGIPVAAAITVLLLRISGVPLLESRLEETRPAYAEYIRRTPAFVPWFPRD